MKPSIALIDHYDSFSFNLLDWLSVDFEILYLTHDDKRGLAELKMKQIPVVLSPGPKAPLDLPDMLSWLAFVIGTRPIFGVCLGHQMIGVLAGGEIVRHQDAWHGTRQRFVRTATSVLLEGLPHKFEAATYNSLVVSSELLVSDCLITARGLAGEVQALEWIPWSGAWLAFGVQFHPESFLSAGIEKIRSNFRDYVERFEKQVVKSLPDKSLSN